MTPEKLRRGQAVSRDREAEVVVEGGVMAGVAGVARRCGGLWRYLIVRAQGRTAVELERERNRATFEAMRSLPRDCELLEFERNGRLRVIRRAGPSLAGPSESGGPLSGQGGELNP